jgi:hypothetical protein
MTQKNQNLPTKTFSKTISNSQKTALAASGRKIRDLSNPFPQLAEIIAYAAILTGIKPDNVPNGTAKAVLVDWMTKNLNNWTIEEIKNAFDLAAADKLDFDCRTFQTLSATFIGQLMSAYQTHKNTVMTQLRIEEMNNERKQLPPNPETEKREFHGFIRDCLIKPWHYFLKTETLTFGILPWRIVYQTLNDRMNLLNVPVERKKEIYQLAVERVKRDLNKITFDKTEANKIKFLRDEIERQGFGNAMEGEIKTVCYEISVRDYFQNLKNENQDFAKIAEEWIGKN